MAMLDYGALLRVDGKFINKNQNLFMKTSDTGYVCKRAIDKYGNTYNIDGEYFVYAGDKDFLLVFYKGMYKIISNGKIIRSEWNMPFSSIVHHFNEFPDVKVSYLSKEFEVEKLESIGTWKDYVRKNWTDATGDESLSDLQDGGKYYKKFLKRAKRVAYINKHGGFYKSRPYRFIAEWDYNGHHYEVIFGYGIDPDKDVWNDIKNKSYGFREEEKKLIDSWFDED